MTAYLLTTTETYRVNSEKEATEFIEAAKKNPAYELSRYTATKKEVRAKGEVIDEYYRVVLTKKFTSEKDPYERVEISYDILD